MLTEFYYVTIEFRPATEADQPGIIALLDSVYGEYGDRVCFHGCDADLTAIATYYPGDSFMVLDDRGTIVGTVAVTPCSKDRAVTWLKRLYLASELRGTGWGKRLIAWAEQQSRTMNRPRLQCWSDVRFERAHAFYRKLGYVEPGKTRTMNDSFMPYREVLFYRDV